MNVEVAGEIDGLAAGIVLAVVCVGAFYLERLAELLRSPKIVSHGSKTFRREKLSEAKRKDVEELERMMRL